ncbi:unnamed protein product [Cunninghamella blakesleeana]
MHIVNLSNWLNNEDEFPCLNKDNDWERLTIPVEYINEQNDKIKNMNNDNDWEIIHPPTLTYADVVKRKMKTMDLQPSSSSSSLLLNKENNQKILYQYNDTNIFTVTTSTTIKYIADDYDNDLINNIYDTRKSKLYNRLKNDSLEYRRRVRVLSDCGLATSAVAYDWIPYDARMVKNGIPSPSQRDIISLIYSPPHTIPDKTGYNPPADPRLIAGYWKYISITDRDPRVYRERKRYLRFLIESTS